MILEPRDYSEYLAAGERPPVHLLRMFPGGELKSELVDRDRVADRGMTLFDSL